jgi:hypothetical protein
MIRLNEIVDIAGGFAPRKIHKNHRCAQSLIFLGGSFGNVLEKNALFVEIPTLQIWLLKPIVQLCTID